MIITNRNSSKKTDFILYVVPYLTCKKLVWAFYASKSVVEKIREYESNRLRKNCKILSYKGVTLFWGKHYFYVDCLLKARRVLLKSLAD